MTHKPASADTIYLALQSFEEGTAVPEWIHLAPAGEMRTVDGRGPYTALQAEQVIANSFAHQTKLPIDENHAIDKAGKSGFASPARGWIVAMEARADGIWGRVDWNNSGRALVEDRAYRGISPALTIDTQNRVTSIQRASLVNTPNLKGLVTLHNEGTDDMNFMQKLAAALGLTENASEADVLDAVKSMKSGLSLNSQLKTTLSLQSDAGETDILAAIDKLKSSGSDVSLQSQLDAVAEALGMPAGAKSADIVLEAKATALKGDGSVTLHSQVVALQEQVKQLSDGSARAKSEAYIDNEIARGRQINKDRREDYVSLHMENPARAEALIDGIPIFSLDPVITSRQPRGSTISLHSEQSKALSLLGVTDADFQKTIDAERSA